MNSFIYQPLKSSTSEIEKMRKDGMPIKTYIMELSVTNSIIRARQRIIEEYDQRYDGSERDSAAHQCLNDLHVW